MRGFGKHRRKARLGLVLVVLLICAVLTSMSPATPGVRISGEGLLSFESHVALAAWIDQPAEFDFGDPPASPGGENWLTGYTYRKEVSFNGSSGAGANYLVPLTVGSGDLALERGTWSVNSKTYNFRIPIRITEETDGVLTNHQVPISVNVEWLKYHGYIEKDCNGDEVEFADEDGSNPLTYWVDPDPSSYGFNLTAEYWIVISLTASQTKTIYLYVDPDQIGASSNFSETSTFHIYDDDVAQTEDDIRYYTETFEGTKCKWNESYAWYCAGRSGGTFYDRSGARFQNVQIPKGPVIMEAFLTLHSADAQAVQRVLSTIQGEAADNAVDFDVGGDYCQAFLDRTRTTAVLSWDETPSWDENGTYKSPPINEVVKEIVDRGGWSSGNAMVIFWENDGSTDGAMRHGDSFDSDSSNPPKLYIKARKYASADPTVETGFCHVALNDRCYHFPNDIRFTDKGGETLLSYWLDEERTVGGIAEFEVEVTDNLDSNQDIYIYYSNDAVTTDASDSSIFSFYNDFESDAEGGAATGFTAETGTWAVAYGGKVQEPFGIDGMFNVSTYKIADNDYIMLCASSWGVETGLSILRSRDKSNWHLIKYIALPKPLSNMWRSNFVQVGDWYYLPFEACISTEAALDEMKIYLLRTKDFLSYEFRGTILEIVGAFIGYGPSVSKFGSYYYLYYNVNGEICVARSADIEGPYVNAAHNPICVVGVAGWYLENPVVVEESGTYFLYASAIFLANQLQRMNWASGAEPWGDDTWEAGSDFPDADTGVAYAARPVWMTWAEGGGSLRYDADDELWELWFFGRELEADYLTNGVAGYATKATLGAGDWTVQSNKTYRQTEEIATAISRTSLSTTDVAVRVRLKPRYDADTVRLLWRATANNSDYMEAYIDPADNKVYLKAYDGSEHTLASADVGYSIIKSQNKDLEVRHDGDNIKVFVNQHLLIEHEDASQYVTGAGYVKLKAINGPGVYSQIWARPCVIDEPSVGTPGAEETFGFTNAPSSWGIGNVVESGTYTTGITHFTCNNTGTEAVDIAISAGNMTGGTQWTASDTATAGDMIFGLKAGNTTDYITIVKLNSPYNDLVTNMAGNTTYSWGMKFYAPTNFTDGAPKEGVVTLTASLS